MMKKIRFIGVMARCFMLGIAVCSGWFELNAQEAKYTDCPDCWNADSLGNHRVVIRFEGVGNIARTKIEWRRRDHQPELKRIIVADAKTGREINNMHAAGINRENGELFFEPVSGKGTYYVYYMPYKNEGRSNYPKGTYLKPKDDSGNWAVAIPDNLPVNCSVTEFQSIDSFNSFFPMEIIATAEETDKLKRQYEGQPFIIFPEQREYAIRMKEDLPLRWIKNGAQSSLAAEARRGEYYAYQLGIYALQKLQNVKVVFSSFKSADGRTVIPASNSICINTNGRTYDNKPLTKMLDVDSNNVQALWCGIDVPKNIAPGNYSGMATVSARNKAARNIKINLSVSNTIVEKGGADEPQKMTRLSWLNSDLAQQNTVIKPYTPLEVKGNSICLLGRRVELSPDGLPKQIETFFTPEMTGYTSLPNKILAAPVQWIAETNGKNENLKFSGVQFVDKEPGTVSWKSVGTSGAVKMEIAASLEFDGFVSYQLKVTALRDVQLSNSYLEIPFRPQTARYLMGLGRKGGLRPADLAWKWEVATKNQDGAWLGNVNAGLQFSLRDEKYSRPLNTNFYLQKPLLLPASWGNEGKGGIDIKETSGRVTINCYSGGRVMKKGETLYYNFTLLITPFHPIDTDFQWANRFYHSYNNIDSIKASGATVINIHHATKINPWINYPFIEHAKMKAYIDEAHEKGLKVKIYNTVRELSNHAYETFALKSLDHEVYSPGTGGGFSWLQEHLDSDYIAAWFVPQIKDAAIVNSGMNRWHNYYVEGMNWLVRNVGIDGIYLDDVAFDRVTMKRIKRVLTRDNHPGIIDLHSANQYNKNDGFNNSANLYMEHFPYLNRLWFGEYFDYEKNAPDFFLTEVSGIPFGLMGEMLQDGGNPWRGMIYGMTNRMPWSDNADPRPIWKLWDDFGIKGSSMIGYWSENCPVKTNNEKVLCTVY